MRRAFTTIFFLVATVAWSSPAWVQAQERQGATSRADPAEITLEPGDVLQVQVWPDEGLSGEFVIEETGYIYLPLLGRIQATGISLQVLREQLREGYGEVMRNPVVTVTPRFSVGVLGAVRAPGIYQATPSSTIIDVVGMAGGFVGNASQERVRLVREGRAIEFNALQALEEGIDLHRYQLESGDQIVVPAKEGATITYGKVVTFIQTGATLGFLIDRILRGFGND